MQFLYYMFVIYYQYAYKVCIAGIAFKKTIFFKLIKTKMLDNVYVNRYLELKRHTTKKKKTKSNAQEMNS